jgi:hypothetical protein
VRESELSSVSEVRSDRERDVNNGICLVYLYVRVLCVYDSVRVLFIVCQWPVLENSRKFFYAVRYYQYRTQYMGIGT